MAKRKTKEKIFVTDGDDVIWNFGGSLCSVVNKIHGTCITEHDLNSWDWFNLDFKDATGKRITGAQLKATFERFEKAGLYASLSPLNDAQDALEVIRSRGYKIFILTARPEEFKDETILNAMKENIIYDELIFSGDKVSVLKELAKTYNIQAFIDDKPTTIQDVYDKCKIKQIYVMNKAWNESVEFDESVKRVNTLYECIRDLKKVK